MIGKAVFVSIIPYAIAILVTFLSALYIFIFAELSDDLDDEA